VILHKRLRYVKFKAGDFASTKELNMGRMTIEAFKAAAVEAGGVNEVAKLTVVKTKTGDKVGFIVQVATTGGEYVQLAGSNGKVKTYGNVDDLIKGMAALQLTSIGLTKIELESVNLLDAKPFTGNIIKKSLTARDSYVAKVDKLTTEIATATTAINLMPTVTVAEQALVAERTAQRDAMAGLKTYYADEVTRLNSIINGAGTVVPVV